MSKRTLHLVVLLAVASTSSAAICRAYGIDVRNVRAHFEWAPSRKIDPSGPSMCAAIVMP